MIELDLEYGNDVRRSVIFPNGQLLALGGDDGNLICIDTATTTASNNNSSSSSEEQITMHSARQYDDDPVCALAVSNDGKRVAVAFDNGAIKIYQYDDYDVTNDDGRHPFVRPPKAKSADDDDDDDDGGGGFLSQSDRDGDVEEEEDEEGRCWAGPPMEGLVRDMKFLPDSHFLVISSESGLMVVNVESSDTMADRYLSAQAEKEHDASGIRGVSINDKNWIASLAMDGRLCIWEASGIQSASSAGDNVPVYRDGGRCVPYKDIGLLNGVEFFDRSCLPLWVQTDILALPGKPQLQLRAVSASADSFIVKESDKTSAADPSRGHIEPIGALASVGSHIVSAGKDGRVILWQIQEDEDGLPTAEFVEKLGEYKSIPTSLHWNEKNNVLYVFCANATLDVIQGMQKKVQQKKSTRASSRKKDTKQPDKKNAEKESRNENIPEPSAPAAKSSKSAAPPEKRSQKTRKRISFLDSDSEDDTNIQGKHVPSGKSVDQNVVSDKLEKKHDDPEEDSGETIHHLETQPPPTTKPTNEPMDEDKDDDFLLKEQSPTGKKQDTEEADAIEASNLADSPLKSLTAGTESDGDEDDVDAPLSDKKNNVPGSSLQSLIDEMGSDDDDDDVDKPSESKKSEDLAISKESHDDKMEKAPNGNPKGETNMTGRRLSKQTKSTQDDNDEDDEDEDLFDDSAAQSASKPPTKNSFIDDEAEDGEGDDLVEESPAGDTEASNSREAPGAAITSTQDGEDEEDQSAGGDGNNDDSGFGNNDDDDDDENSMQDDIDALHETFGKAREYAGESTRGGPQLPEPQAAFAPSSTPLDLPRRFLCWNNIGSITILKGNDMGTRSTVDINFTDSAFRRPISFTDNMGFILGTLGDDGGMFATDLAHDEEDDLEDDEDWAGLSLSEQTKAALKKSQKQRMRKGSANKRPTGSSIYFHRFETFGSLREKDWYLTLPDGERVLGCACGKGWAAVTTSRKYLRFFTSGGAQGQVLWLPGTPVTMVGRDRFLAVFHHESVPLQDGTMKLGYMLYDAVANKTISKGSVSCISAGSSLSWIGFSNDCSLMAMDSDGMLSMLVATSVDGLADDYQGLAESVSWEWSPFLDTVGMRKSSDDNFWPITVYNGKLVCIPLKGGTQYPDAVRRPITQMISLRIPLARSTLAKSSALEELCVRSNVALAQKKANNMVSSGELMGEDFEEEYHTLCAQVDKVTLKLFAATVEAGKLERALDLVDRLQLEKSYDIAMTLAGNHDKLVDHIEDAKERRFAQADGEEEEGYDVEDDLGSDDGNTHFEGPVRTSPEHRTHATRRISPDAASTGKRPFDSYQIKRNVRAKAF